MNKQKVDEEEEVVGGPVGGPVGGWIDGWISSIRGEAYMEHLF